MDALGGVVGPSANQFSVYNQPQKTKATEYASSIQDVVEFSSEAQEALAQSDALKRSEFFMKRRGLDEEEISDYRNIIQRYAESGQDANDFLNSLEKNEKRLVQRANGYDGDFSSKAIDSFSEEGAVNLLQEQGAAFDVDLDGDKITAHGEHNQMTLFPVEAPAAVKDAWEITSEDMSFLEKTIMHIHLMPVKIPGYPDASIIQGYNLNRDGYPETSAGWIDLLGKVYDTVEDGLKYQENEESLENSRQHMRNLEELIDNIKKMEKLRSEEN